MNTSDYQSFLQFFDRMEMDSSLNSAGQQLACISRLVFYCGIKEGEIQELTIRDVIDNDSNIIRVIRKFDKPITLTDELEESLKRHIEDMGSRNPSFVKRRSPLFPAYPNTKKIKRHLKTFGTTYTQIHHAGIYYFYRKGLAAGRSKGWIYKSGSRQKRISARQFQAVALNSKIPPGVPVDNRCIEEIVTILDDAERLDKNAADVKNKATQMIDEYKRVLKRFRSKTLKESYQKELLRLKATLAPFLTR